MRIARRTVLTAAVASAASAVVSRSIPAQADDKSAASAMPQLRAQKVGAGFGTADPPAEVLSYAGDAVPPVLRISQGQGLTVRLTNTLPDPTSLTWTGLRGLGDLAVASGGAVAPGSARDLRVVPRDSGTYMFRPPLESAQQNARGLAGLLIVEEASPPAVDHDLPLLLRDWLPQDVDAAGIAPAPVAITVGGRPAPAEIVAAPGARVRVRLVNASIRRVMLVQCMGAKPLIIAIDGQPSELFEPIHDTVPIGPGARFDLMFDLPRETGAVVTLALKPTERFGGALEPPVNLAAFRIEGNGRPELPPIAALPPNPALPPKIPLERSKRAELVFAVANEGKAGLERWTVNGIAGAPLPPNPVLRVRLGDAVTLGFTNTSQSVVPLRVAGQVMRLLHTKDDGWEPYWRDSVLLPPASRHHVALVADTPGRWPIESAFATQFLGGLRCWFEVSNA